VIAADTSVAVAAALPWHEAHGAARAALRGPTSALIAHVAVETFSVLTRLPSPRRVPASVAREYLQQAFVSPMLTLTPAGYQALLDRAAAEGITGGAIYDALSPRRRPRRGRRSSRSTFGRS
jgi:hypothetical protein